MKNVLSIRPYSVFGNAPGANTFLQGYELVGGDVYAYASAYNRLYEQGLTGAKPEKPRVYAKAAVLPGEVQNMALEAGKKAGRGEGLSIQESETKEYTGDNIEQEASALRTYKGNMWPKEGKIISKDELRNLTAYAKENYIKLVSFENFDGDVDMLRNAISIAGRLLSTYTRLASGKTQLQIHNDFNMEDNDYAMTIGNKIFINNYAFRNMEALAKDYAQQAQSGWFVKGTDYRSIIYHELGHAVANVYQLSPMKIAAEVLGTDKASKILVYVSDNLSKYAGSLHNGLEIISEAFSAVYGGVNNNFALRFLEECDKIIDKR